MGGKQSALSSGEMPLELRLENCPVLGKSYLTDAAGYSLYMYTKDLKNKSTCYGTCFEQWPPVLLPDDILEHDLTKKVHAPGVHKSKLGVICREDNSLQLTFNGWPLYYYYLDKAAGDIYGQTVRGIWYLIDGQGEPIVTPLIEEYQPVEDTRDRSRKRM